MGLSSSTETTTSQQTTKPVYEGQILGQYNNLQDAFGANKGNLANIQGLLSGYVQTAGNNYANNPVMNAANGYVQNTLSQPYGSSPYLQDMIDQTNASVANRTNAALGTRGLSGGTAAAKTIAGALAQNETGLRYNDYNNWQNRQQAAAGMVPGLAGANATNLQGLLGLSDQAANLSTNNALKQALGVGGLLGQYTNSNGKGTEKSNLALGPILASLAASAAQAFGGGG